MGSKGTPGEWVKTFPNVPTLHILISRDLVIFTSYREIPIIMSAKYGRDVSNSEPKTSICNLSAVLLLNQYINWFHDIVIY